MLIGSTCGSRADRVANLPAVLLLLACLAASVAFPGKSDAAGDLAPNNGGNDYCVSENGEDGNGAADACLDGIGLGNGVSGLAVSPDGKRLFVAGFDSFGGPDGDSITTFDRSALGGPLALDSRNAACRSAGAVPGCSQGGSQAVLLTAPTSVAVSPDSGQVYVSAWRSSSVTAFDYLAFPGTEDPVGALGPLARKSSPNGCVTEGAVSGCAASRGILRAYDVVIAPDGDTVYVAGNAAGGGGVAVFDRAADGVLTQKVGTAGCVNDTGNDGCTDGNNLEPGRLGISADGKNLYVASISNDSSRNTVAVFDIDADGTITQKAGVAGCFSDSGSGGACTAVAGLLDPQDVSVTPDGKNVFVSSVDGNEGGAIRVFDRDVETGALTPVPGTGGCFSFDGSGSCTKANGLYRPFTVLATDEAVYVGSSGDGGSVPGALIVLSRNKTDGSLSQSIPGGCWVRGFVGNCRDLPTIGNVRTIAVSPDGDNLYVGSGGITIFDRNDGNVPVTTIDSGPSGDVTATDATFTFSADKPTSGFQCALDYTYQPCTSPVTYENLSVGIHTFEVIAADRFDHVGLEAPTRQFRVVDATPPETTILTGPPASTAATSAEFTFESNEAGSTFECALDGAAFSTCTSPHQVTGLAVGDHGFRVRAIDSWGNTDPTPASHPFTVETTGPGPDHSVTATVTAAKIQKIKGRKVVVSVKVKAGEALTVKASGSAKKGRAKVTFRPVSRKLKAGQISTFRLKPTKARAGKRLAAALKGGKRTTPKLAITMTDGAMNRLVKKPKVKLVGTPRRK